MSFPWLPPPTAWSLREARGGSSLVQALGQSMPPDFAAAAGALGIDVDDLRAALPAPPQ